MSEPLSSAVVAGPILSDRPGDVTTIWRDGEVLRQSPWGKLQVRSSVPPLPESSDAEPTKEIGT